MPSRSVSRHTKSPTATSGTRPASSVGFVTGRRLALGSMSVTGVGVSVNTPVEAVADVGVALDGVAVEAVAAGVRRGPDRAGGPVEHDLVVAGRQVLERVPTVGVGGGGRHRGTGGVGRRRTGAGEQRDRDAGGRSLGRIELAVAIAVEPHEVADRHDRADPGVDRGVGDAAGERAPSLSVTSVGVRVITPVRGRRARSASPGSRRCRGCRRRPRSVVVNT